MAELSGEAHEPRAAFIEFARGGDELGAHVEQALRLDHFDEDTGRLDVGLFEAAGLKPRFLVCGQRAATGDADRDQALPTDDWFAAGKHPRATFVTRAFKDLGGGRYQAMGDLTIRGVSRPVVLPFTLVIAGDTARMNGQLALNRAAFGVGQGKWATGDMVDTQVAVTIALTAHRVH